jgi:hypothetical protein
MPNPPSKPPRFRVRPQSRDNAHKRIKTLKCYQEVYDRILEGWPPSNIAAFIQDIRHEATDLTREGMISAIVDFRASLPPAELIKKRLTKTYTDAAQEVEEGIDEIKELEKLYKLQMRRITIDAETEKKINKLLPTTGQEVRIAREILSTYADLKMDLGLSKRHLGQMDIDARVAADVAVRYTNKAEVQQVLNDPQSRKKVLNLVERLVSKSASSLVQEDKEPAALPDETSLEGNLLAEEDDPLADPIPMTESPESEQLEQPDDQG